MADKSPSFDPMQASQSFSLWTFKEEVRQSMRTNEALTISEIIVLLSRNNKGSWEQFFKNEVFHVCLAAGTLVELIDKGFVIFDTNLKELKVGDHPETPLPEYLEKDLFYISSFISDTPPLNVETWLLASVPFIKNVPTIPSGTKRFDMIIDHLVEMGILEQKKTKGYHYGMKDPNSILQVAQEVKDMIISESKPNPKLCTMMTLCAQIHRGLGFGNKTLLENLFEKDVWKNERTKIAKYVEPKKWLTLIEISNPLIHVKVEIFNSLKVILTPYGSQQHATLRQHSETKESVRQSIMDKGIAPPPKSTIKRVTDLTSTSSLGISSDSSVSGASSGHFGSWLKEHLTLPEALCLFGRSDKSGDFKLVQQSEIFLVALSALSLQELVLRSRIAFNKETKVYSVVTDLDLSTLPRLPFYLDQDLRLATEVFSSTPDAFTLENWLDLSQSKDEKRLENLVSALSKKEVIETKRTQNLRETHYACAILSPFEPKDVTEQCTKAILSCTRNPPPINIGLLLTISNLIPKKKPSQPKKLVSRIIDGETHHVFKLRNGESENEIFLSYSNKEEIGYDSAYNIAKWFKENSNISK